MEHTGKTRLEPMAPAGLRTRPATNDDFGIAEELSNACDRAVIGEATGFGRHMRIALGMPTTDLQKDTIVVEDESGMMIGFGHVHSEPPHVQPRVTGYVHPDHRGRGIGTFLVHWGEARAREFVAQAPADAQVFMRTGIIQDDAHSAALLRDCGLERTRHFVMMRIDYDGEPEAPVWPDGVELRPVDLDRHDRQICAADEEIFEDHWGFVKKDPEQAYTHFRHWLESDPDLDPELWFVAWDGDQIAGISLCWPRADQDPTTGYIGILGVRRPWRGRGLAQALLRHSFCVFHERGYRGTALHADAENITGALRVYTKAGMHITRTFDHYEKELRAGRRIRTEALD
jgi:mycothiol synthase